MRKGFDGLAVLVQETLKRDPHGGHLFVFRGRRGDLVKVLWHDGQGLCLSGFHAQCGAGTAHGWKPLGGWRFGNTIDGSQADYLLVPDAMANLSPVPDGLTDEQVLMCPDIMSTGLGGAESGGIRIVSIRRAPRPVRFWFRPWRCV